MEKEKEIKDLFKSLYSKPEDLDMNIMGKIQELQKKEKLSNEVSHTEKWIFLIPSLVTVAGIIYSLQFIDLHKYSLWWISMLAALVPVLIDKLLSNNRTTGLGNTK